MKEKQICRQTCNCLDCHIKRSKVTFLQILSIHIKKEWLAQKQYKNNRLLRQHKRQKLTDWNKEGLVDLDNWIRIKRRKKTHLDLMFRLEVYPYQWTFLKTLHLKMLSQLAQKEVKKISLILLLTNFRQ